MHAQVKRADAAGRTAEPWCWAGGDLGAAACLAVVLGLGLGLDH